MTSYRSSFAILIVCLGAAGCGVEDPSESAEFLAESDQGVSSIEDVHQYDDCLIPGVSSSTLDLGMLTQGSDPGTAATFRVTECIVSGLSEFNGQSRPYNLQSFKHTAAGQTFILKRRSTGVAGDLSECLKIKLSVVVGATDAHVTIHRVKQLPAQPASKQCSDNGET